MMQYFVNEDGELFSSDYEVFQKQYEKGWHPIWKRIGRAQWRQLKREQKQKAKELSDRLQKMNHDLMFEQVKRLMG